jgi:hypothetical protein
MNAIKINQLNPDTLITNPVGERVISTVSVNAPAYEVWKVVGDFGGFARFIPALASIEVIGDGPGSVRYKKFKEGGHVVVEQLNSRNDHAMTMTWTTLYNTLGIGRLWASMVVGPQNREGCNATWTIIADPADGSSVSADEFKGFLRGFADDAMANVASLFLPHA